MSSIPPSNDFLHNPSRDSVCSDAIQKYLHTQWAGRHIKYHACTDSTNLRARLMGMDGAPHGTLVIADEQTAGRGRMSRSWESRPSDSILMSLLVRPENLLPHNATGLVLLAAIAVAAACRAEGADVSIKWPNDLIVNSKKLCGMLLEMNASMEKVNFAVIGIGINIKSFPYADDLKHAACLTDACGHEVERAKVVAAFLQEFEMLYAKWRTEGIEAILSIYRQYSITLGRRVRVIGSTETFEAQALDILPDGALMVRTDEGTILPIHAGDVSVRGVMDYV